MKTLCLNSEAHTQSQRTSTVRYKNKKSLRLALFDNALNTNRESGVAFPLFIPRLVERLWVGICVRTVNVKVREM